MIETLTDDPLVIVLALIAIGVTLSHFAFRRSVLARAIVRVVFLGILTVALFTAGIIPYRSLGETGSPYRDAVHALLKTAWWLWTAWFVVGFLRAFVIIERRPREGKLLQDLLAGLTYLAAVFAIIGYVFALPVQGLLATSGVVAIILGLALQSTLSDLFSGIVLSFSRPYRPGDWISIDGGTDGRVIETNWRATHVLTARRDLAIVPNSTIAKSKIVNVSSPSGLHGAAVTAQVSGSTLPSAAAEILRHAILNCRSIEADPTPLVATKSINAAYSEFEITFFVEELSATAAAQNELLDWIYRHLTAAGIELAAPQGSPGADRGTAAPARTPAEIVLDWVDIFTTLSAAEREAIACRLTRHSHDEGEVLVEPGVVLQSLFIISSGVMSLTRADDGREVLRLGPGDHFGEIGLFTGAAAIGRITTLTPVTLYELSKGELAPILADHPSVSHELCRALARRQAAGASPVEGKPHVDIPSHNLTAWFASHLHRLQQQIAHAP